MAYFFVFQNKTYSQEHDGSYLWAPQSNSQGHLRHHWTRVSAIRKNDIIIHSYRTYIKAISIATTDAVSAAIPPEISEHAWDSSGWKVSTKYYEVPNPVHSQKYVQTLRELYPDKDGPYNSSNRGNMGYLFGTNRLVLHFLMNESLKNQISPEDRTTVQRLIETVDTLETLLYGGETDYTREVGDIVVNNLEKSIAEMKRTLVLHDGGNETYSTTSHQYRRDPRIAAIAVLRAKGRCDRCGKDAPFISVRGIPFLESHHIIPRAEAGPDNLINVCAMCPNCHRGMHLASDRLERRQKLIIQLSQRRQVNIDYRE
jgi:5-methylcytosine-specific restriction protein A